MKMIPNGPFRPMLFCLKVSGIVVCNGGDTINSFVEDCHKRNRICLFYFIAFNVGAQYGRSSSNSLASSWLKIQRQSHSADRQSALMFPRNVFNSEVSTMMMTMRWGKDGWGWLLESGAGSKDKVCQERHRHFEKKGFSS